MVHAHPQQIYDTVRTTHLNELQMLLQIPLPNIDKRIWDAMGVWSEGNLELLLFRQEFHSSIPSNRPAMVERTYSTSIGGAPFTDCGDGYREGHITVTGGFTAVIITVIGTITAAAIITVIGTITVTAIITVIVRAVAISNARQLWQPR